MCVTAGDMWMSGAFAVWISSTFAQTRVHLASSAVSQLATGELRQMQNWLSLYC